MKSIATVLLSLSLVALLTLNRVVASESTSSVDERPIALTFIKTGIHTDLILPRTWVEHWINGHEGVFGDASHIAIGWGEARYFSARRKSIVKMVPALLLPTRSAIRLRPYDPVTDEHDVSIPFMVAQSDMSKLMKFIDRSILDETETRRDMILRKDAIFYPARLRYSLFRTCNNWSARALKKAGLRIGHRRAMLAGNVTRQLIVRLNQRVETIES